MSPIIAAITTTITRIATPMPPITMSPAPSGAVMKSIPIIAISMNAPKTNLPIQPKHPIVLNLEPAPGIKPGSLRYEGRILYHLDDAGKLRRLRGSNPCGSYPLSV